MSQRSPNLNNWQAAHFGNPAQPYSAEALSWLTGYVLNKRIWCQMLHRDQYGRIVSPSFKTTYKSSNKLPQVAVPMLPTLIPFRHRNVSLEMIRAGWATIYEQSNAKYGKEGKGRYLAMEAAAKYSHISATQTDTEHSLERPRKGCGKMGLISKLQLSIKGDMLLRMRRKYDGTGGSFYIYTLVLNLQQNLVKPDSSYQNILVKYNTIGVHQLI